MRILVLFIVLFWPFSAWADFDQGFIAYRQGDGRTALIHLRPLAKKGQAEAQYYLGRIYYYPIKGVHQNYLTSAQWFRRAAEQGHAAARYKLGGMYFNGYGVKQNDRQASKWWQLAAGQGHHEALNNLGAMFANGRGVLQNMILAYALQTMALANGNELAGENLRNKEELMSPADLDEARRLAEELNHPGMFAMTLAKYLANHKVGKNALAW